MQDKENTNDRSEKVQALLSSPLQWQLRWGTLLIISILLSLAAILPFINYNNTVSVNVIVLKQQNSGTVKLMCMSENVPKLKPGAAISLTTRTHDQQKTTVTSGIVAKINPVPGKGFAIIEMQLKTGTIESTPQTQAIATITLNRLTLYDKLLGQN